MPPSPTGSTTSSWREDPTPLRHHSITELLHDPRSTSSVHIIPPPTLPARPQPHSINDFADYLRDVDKPYRAFLASRSDDAPTAVQASSSASIVTDGGAAPSSNTSDSAQIVVPEPYFSLSYSVSQSPDLAALDLPQSATTLSTAPSVVALRGTLSTRRAFLETQLHNALTEHASAITSAVSKMSSLRTELAATRSAAVRARDAVSAVASAVSADAPTTALLGDRRDNALVLSSALRRVARVRAAADDAHVLVDAGEYPAAMRTVRLARRALAARGGELNRVAALASARASLARAVERIDAALREHIRVLIASDLEAVAGVQGEGKRTDVGGLSVHELAKLVARLGTSALAHRSFLDDVRRTLADRLMEATSLDVAANAARFAAKRAALIHSVFTVDSGSPVRGGEAQNGINSTADGISQNGDRRRGAGENHGESPAESLAARGQKPIAPDSRSGVQDEAYAEDDDDDCDGSEPEDDEAVVLEKQKQDRRRNRENLQELHDAILDMMCGAIDRLVGSMDPGKCSYIVMLPTSIVDESNFFDEAKGALRFGEAMRILDSLVGDIADTFGVLDNNGIPGRRVNALRSKISERSLAFVNAFHKAHSDALTTALHEEKWSEVKIPVGALRLVACLTGDSLPTFNESADAGAISPGERRLASAFVVHDTQFKTVAAGVRYVRSICAFALVVDKLPFASSEAARRGVELSRMFNTLSGRAILGAAALEWAGLRSITARHLSLASRTVSLAVALAPHVGAPLQNAVARQHAVRGQQLEVPSQASVVGSLIMQTEKDMRDHHAQLVAKILFIMMDRLAVHEDVLASLPWTKAVEMQRFEIPSPYVTTLAKEATVLHRILWSVLPRSEVFDIFERVCQAYGSRLGAKYHALHQDASRTIDRPDGSIDTKVSYIGHHSLLNQEWVKKRVMADVAHLHQRIGMLDAIKAKPEAFKPIENLYETFVKNFNRFESTAEGEPLNTSTAEGEPLNTKKPPLSTPATIAELPAALQLLQTESLPAHTGTPASPLPASPLPPQMAAADVLSPAVHPHKGERRDLEHQHPPSESPDSGGSVARDADRNGGPGVPETARFLSRPSAEAVESKK